MNKSIYGRNLRSARIAAGLKQADLARMIGATQSNVSSWERGATAPSAQYRAMILECLGVDDQDADDDDLLTYEQIQRLIGLIATMDRDEIRMMLTYAYDVCRQFAVDRPRQPIAPIPVCQDE